MPPRAIHYYVALVCALAALSLQLVPWEDFQLFTLSDALGLLLLMGFTLLSERLSVGMSLIPRGSHTITFIPLLATVLLFGPAAPVVLMGVSGAAAEILVRKKERIRAVFNIAQYVLSTSVAGWLFARTGGIGGVRMGDFTLQLVPFLVFLFAVMGINQGTVFIAITLNQELKSRDIWNRFLGPSGVNILSDISLSPLAIVVTFFYLEAGWPSFAVSLLPLLFIRHAYLNNFRLEQANRDLLRALVKAIETRDPYTSGHSQRVAGLAGRIARSMNLGPKAVETVEMSALLHDVGKVDVIYSEILRKPDALTSEEQRIMESHVTKGVELLCSLATVPDDVIAAVRHHHERVDGRGYPDGIQGDSIPLGARIIKVCDAVDAMLSDRPYRTALSCEQVLAQLRENAGTEFDALVVECVLLKDLLAEHSATMQGSVSADALPFVRRGLIAGRTLSKRVVAMN
jgi:putative nucleotidyltransferase with HDIG domain